MWNRRLPHPTTVVIVHNAASTVVFVQGQRILATKYRMPSRVMPSHPEEKRRRLGANGLVERPGAPVLWRRWRWRWRRRRMRRWQGNDRRRRGGTSSL
jgi:hypothetical protein